MKSDREVLECELKSATVDMKEQFLNALAHDGNVNEPAMSVEKLGEVYGPIQKRIRESIELQTSLLSEIQVSYSIYIDGFCVVKVNILYPV